MNYLAVDTSGKALNLIIKKDDKIFSYNDLECGVRHSEKIMVEIENLLNKAEFNLKDADFIACVVGAGSFTGIRIGVATVKALCFSLGVKALSVTSFDTLAYNKKGGKILAVIDAGHNGFYVAGYSEKELILEPKYILKDELVELSKEYLLVSENKIEGLEVDIVSVKEGLPIAIEKLKDNAKSDLDKLEPLYVRKSQAEEGR